MLPKKTALPVPANKYILPPAFLIFAALLPVKSISNPPPVAIDNGAVVVCGA